MAPSSKAGRPSRGRSRSRGRGVLPDRGSSPDSAAAGLLPAVALSQDEASLAASLYKRKRALESVSAGIQARLETSLQELQGEFDAKFTRLSDEIQALFQASVEESASPEQLHGGSIGSSGGSSPTLSRGKKERKVFTPQDSLLSKMLGYEDENYKTILHLFVSVLILWGLSLALDDFSRSKGEYHYDLLTWGLRRDLEGFVKFWIVIFAFSFVIVPLAHVAAECRGRSKTIAYAALQVAYVSLQLGFFAFSTYIVQSSSHTGGLFAVPLGLGFMCEQCRMSMKMHAYLREKVLWTHFGAKYACAPRSVPWGVLPTADYLASELAKFRYFHFAPTLVYRDSYPLTRRVRWSFIMGRLMEWCGIVYYAFCIFRQVLPQFEDDALLGQPISLVVFAKHSFRCMAPAMGCMLFTHFLILHVVQNIGAEMSCFADRGFYNDWWNSRTFSVFYRHWNGVVHDFIHCYLYTDLVEFCRWSKLSALLTSFVVSAVVHEYIISIALGFFLPILGALFSGPGLLFILLTKNQTNRLWNVFMWIMLATGNAFLMVLYIREYFCRLKNTPPADPLSGMSWGELGWWDVLVPRTYRIQVAAAR